MTRFTRPLMRRACTLRAPYSAVLALLLTAAPLASAAVTAARAGLGPSPQGLIQSWVASFHLSGHIFHPGERMTGTITVLASQCIGSNGGPCYSGTDWAAAGGKCPPMALTCSWIAGQGAGAPAWQTISMPIHNPVGPASSQDFYAIVDPNTYVLDGLVTDRDDTPMPGVTIDVSGPDTVQARTDSNGYYNVLLHRGGYHVTPRNTGLEGTIAFSPGFATATLGPQSKHVTDNFTLTPCAGGASGPAPHIAGSVGAAQSSTACAATFTYTMPDRLTDKPNVAGVIDYPAGGTSSYSSNTVAIAPSSWPVDFSVRTPGQTRCRLGVTDTIYVWTVTNVSNALNTPHLQDTAAFTPQSGCGEYVHAFPAEGTYKVTIATKKRIAAGVYASVGKLTKTVVVQDWLIAGLGDSVASGEGNPDIYGAQPKWESARCDRSAASFEARTALRVEKADVHTSVTFVHLACSGAGIAKGAVGPFFGEAPGGAVIPLDSQVSALTSLIGQRKVDVLLLSIGANDIGFGDIVTFCSTKSYNFASGGLWVFDPRAAAPRHTPCFDDPFPEKISAKTLATIVQDNLAKLPKLYDDLAARLNQAGIAANRIYITQYFDPTTGADGQPCPSMSFQIPTGAKPKTLPGLSKSEGQWASSAVVHPLNAAVQAAAQKHGWHFVGGIQNGFIGHGYCAGDASYVRTMKQSFLLQGDPNGTMHPNPPGHYFIAKLVAPLVLHDLYLHGGAQGGRPRPH